MRLFSIISILTLLPCVALGDDDWSKETWNNGHHVSQIGAADSTVFVVARNRGVFEVSVVDSSVSKILFDLNEFDYGESEVVGFRYLDPTTGSVSPRFIVVDDTDSSRTIGVLLELDDNQNSYKLVIGPDGQPLRAPIELTIAPVVFIGPEGRLFAQSSFSRWVIRNNTNGQYEDYNEKLSDTTCFPTARLWPFSVRGTHLHVIEGAGDQILVRHEGGREETSTYLLDEEIDCNQLSLSSAFASSVENLGIVDSRSRLHVSGDGGATWTRIESLAFLNSVSDVHGTYVMIKHPSLGEVRRVNYATGSLEPVIAEHDGIRDTLSSLAINRELLTGVGTFGTWHRIGATGEWTLDNSVTINQVDATDFEGGVYSLESPFVVTTVKKGSHSRSYLTPPFTDTPVRSVKYENGALVVLRTKTFNNGAVDRQSSTVVYEDGVTHWFEKRFVPNDVNNVQAVGLAKVDKMYAYYVEGRFGSWVPQNPEREFELIHTEESQASAPFLSAVDKETLALLTESGSFIGPVEEGLISSENQIRLPVREEDEFPFPDITSVDASGGSMLVGYGVYQETDGYNGPSMFKVDLQANTGSRSDSTTSATYVMATSVFDEDRLASVAQRRTLSRIGVDYGPAYIQTMTSDAQRWQLAPINNLIQGTNDFAAAHFDKDGRLYYAARGLDSILVSEPPYSSASWISSPIKESGEFPTSLTVSEERIYVGTNKGLYSRLAPTVGVEIVVPKNHLVGFEVHPNPATDLLNIEVLNSGLQGAYNVEIVDLTGRPVLDLSEYFRGQTGTHVLVRAPLQKISSGLYLIHLSIDGVSKSQILSIVR